jgi:hypothetical protein
MKIELLNDGPVTILIDSEDLKWSHMFLMEKNMII